MSHPTRNVFPLSREEVSAAGATASKEIQMGPVPVGKVWRARVIAVENASGTVASALLAVSRGGIKTPFDYLTTLVSGVPQFSSRPIVIPEDCFLSVTFTTIQATTDMLHVWLVGAEGPNDVLELVV